MPAYFYHFKCLKCQEVLLLSESCSQTDPYQNVVGDPVWKGGGGSPQGSTLIGAYYLTAVLECIVLLWKGAMCFLITLLGQMGHVE